MKRNLHITINKLAPAVLTSLIATSLGLLSLFNSQVPMIQDFGMMLAIGIGVAFLLALMVLLPLLVIREKLTVDSGVKKPRKPSKYETWMSAFARTMYRFRVGIVIVAVFTAGLGFYLDQQVGVETDIETFMPQDSEALKDIHALRDIIGSTDRIVILYHSDDIDSFATVTDIKQMTDMIQTDYSNNTTMVASISVLLDQVSNLSWDETTYDTNLEQIPAQQLTLLQDRTTNQGIISIALTDMDDETFATFLDQLKTSLDQLSLDTTYTITGQSVVDQAMLEAMTSDRLSMTLLGIGLVFLALFIIYRNLKKALIAVLPILFIVGWSGAFMYLFGFEYTPLTSTLGALIIGIGTEFTILILMRYYDFLETLPSKDSMIQAVGKMGKPIIVSAITTMGGFSALIFSDFAILSNFGIMTVVNLSLALISALVVLPALLGVVGKDRKSIEV